MAGLILPRRWNFQPPTGAQVARDDGIAFRLLKLYSFSEGGGIPHDSVWNYAPPSTVARGTWVNGPLGAGMNFASASSQNLADANNISITTIPGSYSIVVWTVLGSGTGICAWGLVNFGSGYSALLRADSGTWNFYQHSSGGDHATSWVSGAATNVLTQLVCVWDQNASTITIYGNGVFKSSASGISRDRTPDNFYIGSGGDVGGPAQYYNGSLFQVGLWSRALRAEEVQRLYADPWCMLEAPRYQKWMGYTPTAAVVGGGRSFAVIIG